MEWQWEDEQELISDGAAMLVPILIQEEDGAYRIEAYEGVRTIVEDFAVRFYGHYFSKKAIDWLDSQIEPWVNNLGYYRESVGLYRWYEVYEKQVIGGEPLGETERWDGKDCEMELLLDLSPDYPAYVVKKDGRIISAARTNEFDPCDTCPEITVETAPGWRGRGYAVSNVTALSNELLKDFPSVSYVCSRYNRASQKTALNAGFTKTGRFYAYTAYKD